MPPKIQRAKSPTRPKSAKKAPVAKKPATAAKPKKSENGVSAQWEKVVAKVVTNILKNASYVVKACGCKTLQEAHLKAVSLIQANIVKQGIAYVPKSATVDGLKIQSGGHAGYVLPPSYFGNPETRYVDISQIAPNEVQLTADSSLARAEHPLKMFESPLLSGGALLKVSATQVKKAIKAFQEKNPDTITSVSKDALGLIVVSVRENLKELVDVVGAKPTTEALMHAISNDKRFIHLKI